MDETHQHEDVVADLTDLQASLRGDDPGADEHVATVHELAWFREAMAPPGRRPNGRDGSAEHGEATVTPMRRDEDLAVRIWRPRQPFEEAIRRLRLAERVSTPDPDELAARGREGFKKATELQQVASRRLRDA